jgi:hypothetical protein
MGTRGEKMRTYDRTWVEIEEMLEKAIDLQKKHFELMKGKDNRIYHMRNYKALEGVIKALKWVLGDSNVSHPLE